MTRHVPNVRGAEEVPTDVSLKRERRRRSRRRRDNAEFAASIVAIILTSAMTFLVLKAEKQLGTDHTQLLAGCARLNIRQAEDNKSHLADYRVFRVVYTESVAAEGTRRLTKAEKAQEHAFLVELNSSVLAKSWTPLTDCRRAISTQGAKYITPVAIHFLDARGHQHLPPAYDLNPPRNSSAFG